MATVNFSVPEEIKREFNQLFEKENKSAILTKLIQQAISEKKRQQRRELAVNKILGLRENQKPVTANEIKQARDELRS